MKQPLSALAASLLALTLLAACSGGPAAVTPGPSAPAGPTPSVSPSAAGGESGGIMSSFSATNLEGDALDASLFADYDLTMVNIWATFCRPCLDEMPDLGEIHAEYADKGFQVVGLVADALNQDGTISESQADLARDIVERTGAHYPHLLPSPDLFGIVAQATSVPTTFFVDKNGAQVGYAYLGSRSKADWIQIIDPLLDEVRE